MTETDMSSTIKTEIIVEMKSGKTDKENNVGEGRILRPRRVNYIINEKKSVKKTVKSCREVPLQIKLEKRNNLRIIF